MKKYGMKASIITTVLSKLLDRGLNRWKLGHWNDALGGAGNVFCAA